jgi:Na+/proline symporter
MESLPSAWAWYIIAATALLMFAISYWIFTRVRVDTDETFMVASRGVNWGLIAASIAATELWAGSLLASAEGVYTWGAVGLWAYVLPTPISFTIFALLARRARRLAPAGLTLGSWVKIRFGSATHVIITLVAIWIMAYFTMLQVIGGAGFFSALFDINYTYVAFAITLAFLIYYLIAGLWSSLVTAFVQYFAVVLILALMVPAIWFKLGGPGEIFSQVQQNAEPQQLNIFRIDGVLNFFLVQFFSFGAIATMSNYAWQRAYAAEEDGMVKGLIIGGWTWVPLALISGTVGLAGLAMGINVEIGSDIFPAVVSQLFSPWVSVTLAIALLFSIYSTGTAYLGGMSSLITSDFYETYLRPDASPEQGLRFIRVVSVVIAILVALATAILQQVSLLTMLLISGTFVGSAFFPLVLGLYWRKTSGLAASIATLLAISTESFLLIFTDLTQYLAYAIGLSGSLVLTVVISLIKPDNFDFGALRRANAAPVPSAGETTST